VSFSGRGGGKKRDRDDPGDDRRRESSVDKKLKPRHPPPKERRKPPPVLGRRSGRLAGERIDRDKLSELLELGDLQARGDRQGGVGIPGSRTLEGVSSFPPLRWRAKMPKDLKRILEGSELARGMELEEKREVAEGRNRRIEFQQGQVGAFSLHVANDIAGVWNSPSNGSRVYDYPHLAPRFESRISQGATSPEKTYFMGDLSAGERRKHVAEGMQHLIAGDIERANRSFADSGATERGQKWINKFSTLMLSERAREVHAGIENPGHGLTHAALDDVAGGRATFGTKFSPDSRHAASFVGGGGAEAHRQHALSLMKKLK